MISGDRLDKYVSIRAQGRCEYCQMSQLLQGATFHVEHVVPRSRGGRTEAANLALACPGCNLRKADKTLAVDPMSGQHVPLFNPRSHPWSTTFNGKITL